MAKKTAVKSAANALPTKTGAAKKAAAKTGVAKKPASKATTTKTTAKPTALQKRSFFVLTRQDRSDLANVEEIDDDGFNDRPLYDGSPFDGKFPKGFKVWLGKGKPCDRLGGGHSWLIVSDRFVEATEELFKGQVEVFDIPVYDRATKKAGKGYKLMHVLGSLKTVATVNGKLMIHFSWGIVLEGDKIPASTHIFRMEEAKTYIAVSREVRQACKAAGCIGLEYLAVSTI
jgi:hypothetical protein